MHETRKSPRVALPPLAEVIQADDRIATGTRRPVLGLLLGAGGVLGTAHAGVIAVLESAGISADVVVGASIGSIFGLALAAGHSGERIRQQVLASPRTAVAQFYLNRLRVDRRTPIGRLICDVGEDTLIEDLPRPFACIAVDRDTGEVVALTRGPILPAIQASIALPGIACPVEINGRRYIDGGLRGSVPAAVARSLGADVVVGVQLTPIPQGSPGRVSRPRFRRLVHATYKRGIAAFGARMDRTSVDAGDAPPLTNVGHGSNNRPDLIILPRFSGLTAAAPFGSIFCLRRGEEAARAALPEVHALLAGEQNAP